MLNAYGENDDDDDDDDDDDNDDMVGTMFVGDTSSPAKYPNARHQKKCIYEKLLRAALSRAAVGRSTAGAMQLTSNGHCSVDGRVNASPPPQKSPFRLRVNLSNPALSPA